MPTEHRFEAKLEWRKAATGVAASNHQVHFAGRPSIEVSAAPQYKGDPSRLNPEELFLASVASCQMLTYLALASRSGIDVLGYEDAAEAKLAIVERRMRISEITLRPKILLGPGQSAERGLSLVTTAHAGCFIASSIACTVHLEPKISVSD